ncbi:hypothetical protein LCGC14_2213490 [marine sediment metagenome]|uniref:Uncharacterized protein n=1 Tax=marine sediment metagenome TaxID=412755 RepID=A0A0F9G8N5_9ZZZZ
MTKTLTKETSKKIAALGIEVETEKWWITEKAHDTTCLTWYSPEHDYIDVIDGYHYESNDIYDVIPAYTFSETLLALEAIGEKLGKHTACPICGAENIKICDCTKRNMELEEWVYWWHYHAHRLTDLFLDGGMKAVDAYIAGLLK